MLTLSVALAACGCALAGTTGALSGHIIDRRTNEPVAGVRVSISAPSSSVSTITDRRGAFAFLSLPPDTYSLSVESNGFEPITQSGINVLADQTQTFAFALTRNLSVIGAVRSRGAADLVKPGTTSDVYSVNAAGQAAAQALGGPGGLNSAYSAMMSVPGVNIPQGQQGWNQVLYIRGGDQDQVGYELDGIPVNRPYDNAPATMLSSLGQAEVQVYTGGTPATADSSGIAGTVNQVVKVGTNPGFANIKIGAGAPTFYHGLQFEFGGATPSHNFSYYVGLAGFNQDYRYVNQANGAGNPLFFYPLAVGGTSGPIYDGSKPAVFAPGTAYTIQNSQDRENVVNLHFGLPHKNGIKDDIQLLYVNSEILAGYSSSVNDLGGINAVNGGTALTYNDGLIYTGQLFAPVDATKIRPYFFPSSPGARAAGSTLPNDIRDSNDNGVAILKLQYQHNFDSRSYARLFGYTEYSNWFINGPVTADLPFGAEIPDYELPLHAFGLNFSYVNALSDKNQLTFTASYTSSKIYRYASGGGFPGATVNAPITNLIDRSGNCYSPTSGLFASCFDAAQQGTMNNPTPPIVAPAGTPALANSARWIVTENGYNALLNKVHPYFTAASLTDQWRPNARTTVNAGLRVENYRYGLDDSAGYAARPFWFTAYNRENCYDPTQPAPVARTIDPNSGLPGPCPSGAPINLVNATGGSFSSTVFQPRIGTTYALDPRSVLRASWGIYARPPDSSWVQYDTAQQNLPAFLGTQFLPYGFHSPEHQLKPDTSSNYDLSYEHQLRGSDLSFKLTPFYRSTQNQLQVLPLNPLTGLDSGLNVGRQRSSGVELAVRKGDFSRDGLSVQLAYTFTRSRIRYGNFANGANVIDNLNAYILRYNGFTAACAQTSPLCPAGATPQATYTNSGVVVSNPYYNLNPSPLLDRAAAYTTYDSIPAPFASSLGYETPDVASLVVGYRTKKWNFTPSLTYSSGASYGSPLTWPGYDPTSCGGALAGGTIADATTCSNHLLIPDKYTGRFDTLGAFNEPARLSLNLAVGYAFTPKVRLSVVMTGLVDKCFQRGYPWDNPSTCVYSNLPSNALPPAGNYVSNAPAQLAYPYGVWFNNANTGFTGSVIPFQTTMQLEIKL